MKIFALKIFMFSFLVFALCSCNDSTPPAATSNAQSSSAVAKVNPAQVLPDTFDCMIYGKELKGHNSWNKELQMLFALAAQGDDINSNGNILFRTFQVYTTQDCNMINYILMPESKQTTSPYILQADIWEPNNQLVCAQGHEYVICYNTRRKEFLLPMNPKYNFRKPYTGDQGKPLGMAVYEHYLFGLAKDHGAYAFDVKQLSATKPLLPKLEYQSADGSRRALFVTSGENGNQLVLPLMLNNKVVLKTLLDHPIPLSTRIESVGGNRFAIARKKADGKPMVLDLKEAKQISIPKALVGTSEIQNYLSKEYP